MYFRPYGNRLRLSCFLVACLFLALALASGWAKNSMKITKVKTFNGAHRGFFSRDGKRIALMSRNSVDVIETATGRKLVSIQPGATLLGLSFSPDDRLLAIAHRRDAAGQTSTKVSIWDATSGREKLTLPVTDQDWRRIVDDLSFSPDGRLLVSNIAGITRLWNVVSGIEERRFLPTTSFEGLEAERALLSPDGNAMAAYFRNGTSRDAIYLWNLVSGDKTVFSTMVYRDWRFSSDSKFLVVTALLDKGKPAERSAAEIWNVATGKRVKTIEAPKEMRGAYTVAFSPDSTLLAIGGFKRFGIFSVENGELLVAELHHQAGFLEDSELPNQLNHIEFSPDGKMLLTSGDDDSVKLWRLEG